MYNKLYNILVLYSAAALPQLRAAILVKICETGIIGWIPIKFHTTELFRAQNINNIFNVYF